MKCKSENEDRININPKLVILCFTIYTGILLCLMLYPERANSGPYLDSAHGDTSIGVDRTGLSSPVNFGYSKGNCAHCHEQHASIGGSEPAPSSGSASKYLLFRSLFADQGAGFCFRCHIGTSSIQDSMPDQYSYSHIAGGDTNICPDGIKEAFAFLDAAGSPQSNCSSDKGSSHFLANIQTFITAKGSTWNFSSTAGNNNPCSGCHNPHRAQRDPHTNTSDRTVAGELIVSSVSRPSQHSKDNNEWELWGDESGERMNDYSSNYQAPYRISATNYEPDGSATTNGSNLVDYVTFCTDCHNTSNTISSTPLGGSLRTINWSNEKHGQGSADGSICVQDPYITIPPLNNKVLSCLDCHEPHGAPSKVLIRQKVNGGTLDGFVTTIAAPPAECPRAESAGNKEIAYLCDRCHQDDKEINPTCQEDHWYITHHDNTGCNSDRPYAPMQCSDCHAGGMSFTPETPVLMSDRTQKPIGEIRAGDRVLSFDFDNNTASESEVIDVSNEFVNETLEINGVRTTSGHLFAVGRDQWVEAGKLKTGDTVLVLAGHGGSLERIKLEKPVSSRHPEKVKVVDITLKGTKNFFIIGKENKFLVHNSGGGNDCTSTRDPINCNCCHFHGSDDSAAPFADRTGRKTF
jgi:predicted CXXCH cytochrome family protein